MCNPRLNERAKLVAVQEPMLCEYALTVETPEVCPPPRKACNDSSLKGATAQGSFDLGGYGRNFTVDFNQVRAQNCMRERGRTTPPLQALAALAQLAATGVWSTSVAF